LATTGSVLPFRQFVLKVHSRCDLACDHCYVYEHADQSWRNQPKVMTVATAETAGDRIAEHAAQHRLPEVRVVLHGGEPLLAGAARLEEIIRVLHLAIDPVCRLDLRIHTNGIRLDTELCELFLAAGVKVGISLDGDRAANDLHRRYADGRSSYDQVISALGLLMSERYRQTYAGLLCTIDVRSDPVAAYRSLAALDPPDIDFLLPHATWDTPPPGGISDCARTPYADWLAAVYDAWTADGRPVPIRIFDSIIATSLGGVSRTEALGLAASDLAVIETNGAIEQADSIKVAYDGAPATGFSIDTHALDDAAAHPAIQARQRGLAGLSQVCRECPVVTSCGGGLYAHRYRAGQGFNNPSVYCADLKKMISRVRSRLSTATSSEKPSSGHQLSGAEFDELAAGYGDATTIAELMAGQQSRRRVLLGLLERANDRSDAAFTAGWDLAARVGREYGAALALVFAHPYVRAWAERCLRTQAAAGTGAGEGLPPEAGHLAAIAAAAAIRAGLAAEIEVPVADGYLCLPTLGRLDVGQASCALVTIDEGKFTARVPSNSWEVTPAADGQAADWQPVRELRSGPFVVRLEDTDPYRDCHQWPAASRLSAAEAARWQDQFAVASALIEGSFSRYLPALTAGLSTVMPLASDASGRDLGASARQAFGAVGAALPADGNMLALLLLHEFQHVKLGALLDLFELCDRAERRLFYAPWRDDPRPLMALLQGTYAHLAVTDFWRIRRQQLPEPAAATAAERFARWRMLTAEAIETLAASGSLTSLGARFTAGMRATVQPWLDEPVPPAARAAAREWAEDRKAAWQLRRAVQDNGRRP
jgi:uncharacterized protein